MSNTSTSDTLNPSKDSAQAKKELVPELRFPEFRKNGEWEEKKLGEVATFLKGKGISKSDIVENGDLPCIRYGELYTQYNETISAIKSYTNLKVTGLVLSKANDVIIPASGETQIDIAISSCVLERGIALGGDLNIIRTKINGVFLSYYLNNAKRIDIARMAQGISVVHLYPNQLKILKINFPESNEQQKIASCLSSLDDLIAAHNDKLEALKNHKKGLMQNLFPHTSTGSKKKVPNYRFSEFAKDGEWGKKELSELGDLINGLTYSPKDVRDKGLLVLRSSNIQNGLIDFDDCVFVRRDIKGANLSESDDILICIRNGSKRLIGKNALISKEIPFATHGAFMSVFRAKYPDFIFQLFQSEAYNNQVKADLGATINSINGKNFLKYEFLVPRNSQEQQKIASCLSSLDELITVQSEKIEQLKQHKKGFMQGLFPKP